MNQEDIDDFVDALPSQYKNKVNPEILKHIKKKMSDPDMYEDLRDKMISYASVLKEGKFRVKNYLDGVRYMSYRAMGMTNEKAYEATFTKKVKEWRARGMDKKTISSYVSQYNKSKLIVLLYERTMIPVKLLNQDNYQKAINKQVQLLEAKSEFVQQQAANSLMVNLAPDPKMQLPTDNVDQQNSIIKGLREATTALVNQQRKQLEDKVIDASDLAASQLMPIPQTEDAELVE